MKNKLHAVTFIYASLEDLEKEINDYLKKDDIEYVDLKYSTATRHCDCFGYCDLLYSAILIYKYTE